MGSTCGVLLMYEGCGTVSQWFLGDTCLSLAVSVQRQQDQSEGMGLLARQAPGPMCVVHIEATDWEAGLSGFSCGTRSVPMAKERSRDLLSETKCEGKPLPTGVLADARVSTDRKQCSACFRRESSLWGLVGSDRPPVTCLVPNW